MASIPGRLESEGWMAQNANVDLAGTSSYVKTPVKLQLPCISVVPFRLIAANPTIWAHTWATLSPFLINFIPSDAQPNLLVIETDTLPTSPPHEPDCRSIDTHPAGDRQV